MALSDLPINAFRREGRAFCAKPLDPHLGRCNRDQGHDGVCAWVRRRLLACVRAWPEADSMAYDPSCCRFPGSCSAESYDPYYVPTDAVEPDPTPSERTPSSMSESSGHEAGTETSEQPGAIHPDVLAKPTSWLGPDLDTCTIAIGNSDDRLTQAQWAKYVDAVDSTARAWADEVHGHFLTSPASPYQSACWIIEVRSADDRVGLARRLSRLANAYEQDSIALVLGATHLCSGKADA